MAKDPVCGVRVDEKQASATSAYDGPTYYFCSRACKAAFEKNPEKFVRRGLAHDETLRWKSV
jgi:YHS domain-containing protein